MLSMCLFFDGANFCGMIHMYKKKFSVNYAYVWQLLFPEKAKLIYGNKLTSWLKVSVMSFKTNRKVKYSTVNCLLYNDIQMTFLITWHNDYSQGSEPDHLMWYLIHYWLSYCASCWFTLNSLFDTLTVNWWFFMDL